MQQVYIGVLHLCEDMNIMYSYRQPWHMLRRQARTCFNSIVKLSREGCPRYVFNITYAVMVATVSVHISQDAKFAHLNIAF